LQEGIFLALRDIKSVLLLAANWRAHGIRKGNGIERRQVVKENTRIGGRIESFNNSL
jgi:hypothetical protein